MDIFRRDIDAHKAVDEIATWIKMKVDIFNKDGAIIGLSGGIDSTVTAFITTKALSDNKYKIIGTNMPMEFNDPFTIKNTRDLARLLGIDYDEAPIQHIVDSWGCLYRDIIDSDVMDNQTAKGNMIARIRANYLHTVAENQNLFVIGTGNYDEDHNLGYYTLYGDGAVHISPIGSLTKRHVGEIAIVNELDSYVLDNPTAELEPGQTDFKDLGYEYGLVELVCCGIDQNLTNEEMMDNRHIHVRLKATPIKYETLYGETKFNDPEEILNDIRRRRKIAKKKEELLHPDYIWIEHSKTKLE